MRIIARIIGLIIAFLSLPMFGQVAYVGSVDNADYTGSNITTLTATGTSIPAGATIMVASGHSSASSVALADSLGGTFTQIGNGSWLSGSSNFTFWCMPNAAAGTHTFTLTQSPANPYVSLFAAWFSGGDTTNPCAATPVFGTNYGTSGTSGPVTTTANNMVTSFVIAQGTTFPSAGGYTLVNGPISGIQLAYQTEATAGSYAPTFSGLSSPVNWVAGTAAISPTASTQAADPVFSPSGGTVPSGTSVTMTCSTPSSTMYYTTDTTTPTTSSTPYTSPVPVGTGLTLKAICTASGYTNSNVVTGVYSVTGIAAPVISFASAEYTVSDGIGGNLVAMGNRTFNRGLDVQIAPSNIYNVVHSGATPITTCYTTDTSTPTATTPGTCDAGSTSYVWGYPTVNSFHVAGTTTIKAIATAAGSVNSSVTTAIITVLPMYPAPGTYTGTRPVTLSGPSGTVAIIYTTDTTTPTANSSCAATNGTAVTNGSTINIASTSTLTADWCAAGGTLTPLTGSPGVYTIQSSPTYWYIRADGGTRYSANVPTGQCNGRYNAAYPGAGVNQNCAYNDVRYLWDDDGREGGQGTFVMAGGDIAIIAGCSALPTQSNPSNPDCRLGWDQNNGGSGNSWCYAVGNQGCYNPTIPPGTAAYPTEFLGANYAACATAGNTDPKTYQSNLAQLFGGFGLQYSFDLSRTEYVKMGCIELTTHNGVCLHSSVTVPYPRSCSTSPPDDYADNGFKTDYNTNNVTFQDVYVHGMDASAKIGPFGPGIVWDRANLSFDTFAADNWDDGYDTPNTPDATVSYTSVYMVGLGCNEQYPIVNAFPALGCYGTLVSGFGDSLSGQDTAMDSVTFSKGDTENITKDAFIGPHPNAATITVTQSKFVDAAGSIGKFIPNVNGNVLWQNNLMVGNCYRFGTILPGAPYSYLAPHVTGIVVSGGVGTFTLSASNAYIAAGDTGIFQNFGGSSSGLDGSYYTVLSSGLTATQFEANVSLADGTYTDAGDAPIDGRAITQGGDLCRAGGNTFAFNSRAGATINIIGNSVVDNASATIYASCGLASNDADGTCGTAHLNVTDNLFLSYNNGNVSLFEAGDPTVTWTPTYDIAYGQKPGTGLPTGSGNKPNTDPQLVNEPTPITQAAQGTVLDNFDFYPTSSSPAINAGTPVAGLTTDYYGTARSSTPTLGGVEYTTANPPASAPTFSPVSGTYVSSATVSLSTSSSGAIICWNTTSAVATNGTTGCSSGNLYGGPIFLGGTTTLYAVAGGTGFTDSTVSSSLYTIVVADPTCTPAAGTYSTAQTVTCSSATPFSTTYCTIDGSDPTTSSPVCTNIPVSSTLTLKAISAKSLMSNSNIVSQNYIIGTASSGTQLGVGVGLGPGVQIQ